MLVDFERLIPNISKHAPQCPDPTIEAAITNVLRDMCRKLRCWHVDDDFTLSGDNPEIMIAPDGAIIYELGTVTCKGVPLDPITFQRMSHLIARDRGAQNGGGTPRFYCLNDSGRMIVHPNTAGSTLHVSAYLSPDYRGDMIPDHILEQYGNTIENGALASILIIPDQPWTNPQLASIHAARYQSQIDDNSTRWIQGAQAAPLRIRAQFM